MQLSFQIQLIHGANTVILRFMKEYTGLNNLSQICVHLRHHGVPIILEAQEASTVIMVLVLIVATIVSKNFNDYLLKFYDICFDLLKCLNPKTK